MLFHKVTDFIHDLYDVQDFVPLAVPMFIGNEKISQRMYRYDLCK